MVAKKGKFRFTFEWIDKGWGLKALFIDVDKSNIQGEIFIK